MTATKNAGQNTAHWLTNGIDIKTVVWVTVALVASHFTQSNRITIVEQGLPALEKQTQANTDAIQRLTIDTETVETAKTNMDNVNQRLTIIQQSQDRIEQYLLEHK